TGADVPGFFFSAPEDLVVRFFQAGSFVPLFRGHSWYFSKDKEPYSFSEPTVSLVRDAIRLRYSLLREWYSGFEKAVRTKSPPLSPCFSDSGRAVTDQFLLFDKLLVAPVLERDREQRLLYLPAGAWYQLGDTQTRFEGNSWIVVPVNLASMPVFVREGTILTRNEPCLRTSITLSQPETFECYRDAHGQASGYWFDEKAGGYSLAVSAEQEQVVRVRMPKD
ncbi:MAG: hypothetical protein KDD62_07810, partial [Bdellovibrionales bacterium]|nr:hypothetical protein [Bdellovibrionales bacterium]